MKEKYLCYVVSSIAMLLFANKDNTPKNVQQLERTIANLSY